MYAVEPTFKANTARVMEVSINPGRFPVTLAEVRQQLRIFHQEQDRMLERYIDAATQAVENYLQRALISRQYIAYLNRFLDPIYLRFPPVISLESLEYMDVAGFYQSVDSSVYFLENLTAPASITLLEGQHYPQSTKHPRAIRITYTSGYGTLVNDVPEDIRVGILAVINAFYDNASAIDPMDRQNEMQAMYHNIFSPYRMHAV